MKLLITGGLGFIGSNFIMNLMKEYPDYHIINVDAEFYGSNHNNISNPNDNYEFIKGNITDHDLMKKLISKVDVIINFAAESFVDKSIANAEPFLSSNVGGVFTILESIKNTGKKLIHISTDEVYGSLTNDSAIENSRFNPSSPYAATKACAELLVNSYVKTYDINCIITRCTNNFGPRQFPEKLIPKTIILAHQNKKIPVYGKGNNIRDWIYVDDHCNAILSVLKNGKNGESYNVSTANEIDNITVIKKILEIMNKPLDLIEHVEDRPGHDFRYSMNSTRIRNELKWEESVSFEEGLEKTINWYLGNLDWWKNINENVFTFSPWKKITEKAK